jgi:hypothetical protein
MKIKEIERRKMLPRDHGIGHLQGEKEGEDQGHRKKEEATDRAWNCRPEGRKDR